MNNKSVNQQTHHKRENEPFKRTYTPKPFEQLNMMDSFLFESATEDIESAKKIVRVIIERATGHRPENLYIEPQKELKGINIDAHGIRMDVYTTEMEGSKDGIKTCCVYDIEPNHYEEKHIGQRNRYYQSLIDSKLLAAGEEYETLPNLVSIWILSHDPFGEDRMIYTVKNMVVENNELVYNDGVLKIFLYTKGKIGGTESLKRLLTFLEESNSDNATDEELQEIQHIVEVVKCKPEVKRKYMAKMKVYNWGPIEYEIRDAAFAEGKQEGEQIGEARGETRGESRGKIIGAIEMCKGLEMDIAHTKLSIVKQFALSEEEADEYMNLYW